MANGVGDSVTDQPDDAGAGAGAPSPPGGDAPGGPPQAGGPILAALSRQQTSPQISAPGPGNNANSMTMIQNALGLIQQALPGLPQGSPIHSAALKAATQLSRHMAQGAPTAGVQQTQLMDLLRSTMRNAILQKIMGQQGQQQQNMGAPAGPIGGAAPMPSTPLPGA